MDVSDLRCFVAVAEELHFGRAAQRLFWTTSHISHQIQRFERELGIPLFERTTRTVQLTPAGSELLDDARGILESVENFARRARHLRLNVEPGVTLVYAPTSGPIMAALVKNIRRSRPTLEIDVVPKPTSPQVVTAVEGGEASVGVGDSVSPSLQYLVLGVETDFAVYMPAEHRYADRSGLAVEDLDGEPLIVVARDINAEAYDSVITFFEERQIHPVYRPVPITSPSQCIDLVAVGQGLAIGNVGRKTLPGTVSVPLVGEAPPRQTYMIWPLSLPDSLVELIVEAAGVVQGSTTATPIVGSQPA
jgi:DNA-binding transcriptional LysR family regulator